MTLPEVLVATTIFAAAVIAVIGALGVMAKSSDVARRGAMVGAVGETAAERLAGAITYTNCASAATYQAMLPAAPTGYTTTVQSVSYWDGNTSPAGFTSSCTTDRGVQRITIRSVSAGSTYADEIVLTERKP